MRPFSKTHTQGTQKVTTPRIPKTHISFPAPRPLDSGDRGDDGDPATMTLRLDAGGENLVAEGATVTRQWLDGFHRCHKLPMLASADHESYHCEKDRADPEDHPRSKNLFPGQQHHQPHKCDHTARKHTKPQDQRMGWPPGLPIRPANRTKIPHPPPNRKQRNEKHMIEPERPHPQKKPCRPTRHAMVIPASGTTLAKVIEAVDEHDLNW